MLSYFIILNRSQSIILLFIYIAVLFTVCFSSIAKDYYTQKVNPDFLSDSHIGIFIDQDLSATKNPVTTKDLISYCESKDGDFILYEENFQISGGKALYLSGNTSFKLEIVEGRSFTEEDFKNHRPVAIISDTDRVVDKCILRDGREYYLYENNEYEVIGKFKELYHVYPDQEEYDALYFVNMAASFDANLNTSLKAFISLMKETV
ncbi:MAG: hypothetical protein PHG41_04910 [Actinomycetota bacterium]|nr:hypothetical protein [Actinomycetota bacterium]